MTNPDWTITDIWDDHAKVFVEGQSGNGGHTGPVVIVEFHEDGQASRTLAYTAEAARELAAVLNQAAKAAEK